MTSGIGHLLAIVEALAELVLHLAGATVRNRLELAARRPIRRICSRRHGRRNPEAQARHEPQSRQLQAWRNPVKNRRNI
ncbi:MAG: hypothetical protein ACTHP8_22335 [Bosea sp. (in: a-proteobacteria)]|uniref:hypothetical protein n=1 Tax=Bosea sp. (in: a-proteobacteria) TaxID=1871050 RepID=UPI003F7B6A5E